MDEIISSSSHGFISRKEYFDDVSMQIIGFKKNSEKS